MELLSLLREFGPTIGVIIFFIWKDWKREDRSTARIEKLEDEMREIVLPLVANSTAVVAESTAVIAENTNVMRGLERALEIFNGGKQ